MLQVTDLLGKNAVVVSIHGFDGHMACALDEEDWERFKKFGDDAMNVSTGRTPPRTKGDPDFFEAIPVPTYSINES